LTLSEKDKEILEKLNKLIESEKPLRFGQKIVYKDNQKKIYKNKHKA
jgi:hypothetical protein